MLTVIVDATSVSMYKSKFCIQGLVAATVRVESSSETRGAMPAKAG